MTFFFSIRKKLAFYMITVLFLACLMFLLYFTYDFSKNHTERVNEEFNKSLANFEKIFYDELDNIHIMNTIISKNQDLIEHIKDEDLFGIYGKLADLRRDLNLEKANISIVIYDEKKNKISSIPGEFKYEAPSRLLSRQRGVGKYFRVIEENLFFISKVPSFDSDGTFISDNYLFFNINENFLVDFSSKFGDEIIIEIDESIIATTEEEVNLSQNEFLFREYEKTSNPESKIIVAKDITYISEDLRKSRLVIFQVFGVILLLSGILSNFASRSFTLPIMKLAKTARSIGRGNLDIKSEIKSEDEIGQLAHTIDKMRINLKKHTKNLKTTNIKLDRRVYELSILNELNQELNYLKDYNEVFRILLKKIVTALKVERASVMLYEKNELKAVELNIDGDFHEVIPKIKIKKGEGAAGIALKKNLPVVINDCQHSRLFQKSQGSYTKVKNIVCVPFHAKENVKGVFNIINSPCVWQRKDIELIKLIINTGLIAVDNAKLYELAITDGLTGLYIHRYFQLRLQEEISKARRYKQNLSLAMIDIDFFKKFNDKYGHQTGDRVLKQVSNIIGDNIRNGVDIPARYGGEEFAVIMPDTEAEGAQTFIERLRNKIEKNSIFYDDKKLNITISAGIATYPLHGENRLDLIKKADKALYFSKENGRNKVSIFNKLRGEK
ncbi:MAG: diguanylate cyclase [Candidatus Muiribacteriota bacterium]